MARRFGYVFVAIASALLVQPSPSLAQTKAEIEMARNLMDEGDAQAEKGDLKGALRAYRAAHTIMNVPTTGIEVARTEAKIGNLVAAHKIAREVVRLPAKPKEPKPFLEARVEAQRLADDLDTKIPRLTIVVQGVPADAPLEVKIDGQLIPSEEARSPRMVDPGKHDVWVTAMGFPPASKTINIAEAQKLTVTFGPEDAASSSSDPDKPARKLPSLTVVGFGLAGAGVIAGAITGGLSLSRGGEVEKLCPAGACPSREALEKAGPLNDSAFTFANISNVAFALGAVGVGLGVTGLVLSGREAKKPADAASLHVFVGPNGALVTGSF